MVAITTDERSLGQARAEHLERAGLGDGGYDKAWVELRVGPIPFFIPNTPSRKRAVPLHDLHHLLTGYKTDWPGEFEIAAFEVGSGCRDYLAAWVLDLSSLPMGCLFCPRRTWRAFLRGRGARNLYHEGMSAGLLDERVDEVRARLGLDDSPPEPGFREGLAFAGWTALGTLVGTSVFLAPLVAGIALLASFL